MRIIFIIIVTLILVTANAFFYIRKKSFATHSVEYKDDLIQKTFLYLDDSKNKKEMEIKEAFSYLVNSLLLKESEIESLFYLSNSLHKHTDEKTILDSILKEMVTFFSAESGSIFLYNEANAFLELVHAVNINKKYLYTKIPIGNGIAGYVALTGTPVILNKNKNIHNFKFKRHSLQNSIVYPMFFKKKLIGVITLNNPNSIDIFPESEILSFINSFAIQASILLDNFSLINNNKLIYKSIIRSLVSAIDAKDPYTSGHSERVTSYALAIGEELMFDYDMMERLEFSSILHDVGKIGISETILQKPGKLTVEEFTEIQKHPVMSAKIVEPIIFPYKISLDVIGHHERWDGKGYPSGTSKDNISIFSRIITVADSFDAITSSRPYRDKNSIEYALNELVTNSGSQFDPEIVKAFLSYYHKINNANCGIV